MLSVIRAKKIVSLIFLYTQGPTFSTEENQIYTDILINYFDVELHIFLQI